MKKDSLIERVQTSRRQLERYLFYFEKDDSGQFVAGPRPKFSPDEMLKPDLVAGRSLREVLSELVAAEQRLVAWIEAVQTGQRPAWPPPDAVWHPDDLAGRQPPADYSEQPADQVLDEFRRFRQPLLAALAAVPERALFTPGAFRWTGDAALADVVATSTWERYDWAKGHIRRWRKRRAGRYLNKQEILDRIQTEHRRLEQNLNRLDERQMTEPGVVGDWSVKDVLAHLSDWEQRFLGWYRAGQQGQVPQTPAPGLSWSELDELNRQIYEKYRDRPLAEVLEAFQRSYQEAMAAVTSMSEEEIFAAGRYEWVGVDNSLVGFILANTANHYRWAKEEIRSWMKGQGIL